MFLVDVVTLTGLILILAVTIFIFVAFYYCFDPPFVKNGSIFFINPEGTNEAAIAQASIPDPGYEMQSPGPSLALLKGVYKGVPILNNFNDVKKTKGQAILCNHEPYSDTTPYDIEWTGGIGQGPSDRSILILNAYTGHIYQNPGLYSPNGPPLNIDQVLQTAKKNFEKEEPRTAFFGTYRSSDFTKQFPDLKKRQDMALTGRAKGVIQIFGGGWPFPVEHSSRNDERQIRYRKQLFILRNNFAFSLCSENTQIKNYITEKIWAAIEGYTLPIYRGGNNIESFMPLNSFVDINNFSSDAALFTYLNKMSWSEYSERMKQCIIGFNQNRNKYETERVATQKRLEARADKYIKTGF